MILYESLPDSIEVEGKQYKIYTDFREWIKFQDMLRDTSLSNAEKMLLCKEWFIDMAPMNKEIVKGLCDFLVIAQEEKKRQGSQKKVQPIFSYMHDANVIYADFMREYRIDLIEIPYMHWWKFKALLEGLSDEAEFKKRIYYRSVDLSKIKDKNERRRIEGIKKTIALPQDSVTDEDIGNAFW